VLLVTDSPLIVLFDGHCAFCSRWVRRLLRWDRRGALRFGAQQSEGGKRLLLAAGVAENPGGVVVLDTAPGGQGVFVGSDAVGPVAARLGWPWRLAAVAAWVPRCLREPIYQVIARNRYRWFGRTEACFLPPPDLRNRFVD
jgi:predicted DCC family thiol-disulfide oxidoreductase YuxK